MRKYLMSGLLATAAVAAMTVGAAANDTRVRIINNTEHAITGVYVAHIAGGRWSSNLLDEAIQPDESAVVDVDDEGLNWCRFNIHARLKGGYTADKFNYNACELDHLSIN